ncbi:MAG TPA: hypothetical protein VFK54_12260 [Candidatus Limnocylindrales bacterium]|nr:hypothetical protein [Candidatus Limnocylindrales bacterium]
MTVRSRVRRRLREAAVRLAWLGAALGISLGAAGLATAMNRPAGTAARPELTWVGDAAAIPALADAEAALQALDEEVAALGSFGRLALQELTANDQAGIDEAITGGTAQLATVQAAVDAFRARLDAVPGIGAPDEAIRLSQAVRDRYDLLVSTVRATDDLSRNWTVLTAETLNAGRLTALLLEHDRAAGVAALAGSRGDYAEALESLDLAEARLESAREIRDDLEGRVDVTTLDRWLERAAVYDAALRELYEALEASGGVVSDRVREAAAAELEARDRLPEDTRALVVVMADIAEGGLNGALIAIEQTRGALGEALAALRELSSPAPTP